MYLSTWTSSDLRNCSKDTALHSFNMPKQKLPKQKVPKGAVVNSTVTNDPRFASISTDPKYRLPSKKHTRTPIDQRFSRVLEDDDFINTAKVDKYGRKVSSQGKKKVLEKLYQPAPPEDDEGSGDDEDVEVEDDDVVEEELRRAEKMTSGYDAARGGGFSSSEDESEDDEDDDDKSVAFEDQEQFPDMAEEQQSVPMGEVTNRIAVVNLDWDNISSSDLFAVFSSFVPAGGRILKVSVYKSEFGKERMEREEMEGPPREIFQQGAVDEDERESDSEDDEVSAEEEDSEDEDEKIKQELLKPDDGKDFDSGALRQYQLERLRYYYAVVLCSDKNTARKLYDSTDGTGKCYILLSLLPTNSIIRVFELGELP